MLLNQEAAFHQRVPSLVWSSFSKKKELDIKRHFQVALKLDIQFVHESRTKIIKPISTKKTKFAQKIHIFR